jgi:hypothetical protein
MPDAGTTTSTEPKGGTIRDTANSYETREEEKGKERHDEWRSLLFRLG